MSAEVWLRALGAAADELGYGIVNIEPSRIVLVRERATVTIESKLLSGALLLELLVRAPERKR